jgi:glycosyltransferase involved in cell wall biosynthesis
MPNPVDPDEFRPARPGESEAWRESHGIAPSARVVIYVGRLSHEKGLRPLIGGFARAARQVPEALLALVGDGALRPELETLARQAKLHPGQIRFVGRVAASEIPFWLRASDIFSLTSPSEGFACALLEAMSVGLPSVVSAIPANLQLIDEGVHGLTVPYDGEEAIAEAFLKLFRDAEMRRKMGNAAHLRAVENYSTAKVIERYEALFDDLIRAQTADVR